MEECFDDTMELTFSFGFIFLSTCGVMFGIAMQRVSFVGTNEEEEVRRLYGSGFAMKLATERRLAQNMMAGSISIGGGTVLSSASTSNLMTDILTGRDQQIGFEDTLGLPEFRPTFNRAQEDPHLAMEQTLGL